MRKSVFTEGEYNFTNGGYVNLENDSIRNASVCRHEAQHAELYSTTSYGILTLMADKNKQFDVKSAWVSQELVKYMNRMQERIAVNIELMSICEEKGLQEYLKSIEELKDKNNTYYNYFRKLCCINKKIEKGENVNDLINILRAMGRLALSINVENIPFSEINSPEELQAFFTKGDNVYIYIPNKRFDVLVDVFFRGNYQNEKINIIMDNTIEDINNRDIAIENAKVAAKKILYGNPLYTQLVERLNTISTMKIDAHFEHLEYLINMPLELDNKFELKFVDMPIKDFIDLLQRPQYKDHVVRLEHSMRGFENIHIISLADIKLGKIYITYILNENIYYNVIKMIQQHVVLIRQNCLEKLNLE